MRFAAMALYTHARVIQKIFTWQQALPSTYSHSGMPTATRLLRHAGAVCTCSSHTDASLQLEALRPAAFYSHCISLTCCSCPLSSSEISDSTVLPFGPWRGAVAGTLLCFSGVIPMVANKVCVFMARTRPARNRWQYVVRGEAKRKPAVDATTRACALILPARCEQASAYLCSSQKSGYFATRGAADDNTTAGACPTWQLASLRPCTGVPEWSRQRVVVIKS